MDKNIILKYDKDIALKTGALSRKLYIFMLSFAALIVLISSAIFEFFCYVNGFAEPVISKYTSKIIYMSLFIALIWLFSMPSWYPAYIAERIVFVKKGDKLYKIKNKKDNIFDREKYIDNEEFLDKVIKNLPNENTNVLIEEFENYHIIKKTKKYLKLQVETKNKENKKIKIYNVYSNFENL